MDLSTIIITYWKYIVSVLVSGCFLVVNIIQFFRTKEKNKLKEAICRIPEIIRSVEELAKISNWDSTTATIKSAYKLATAESLLRTEVGDRFFNKYASLFDDVIEDILNTPQKKGGSHDGISKENEAQ